MKLRIFLWITFIPLFASMQVNAFTLNGKVVGQNVRWDNAANSPIGADEKVLTSWEPIFGLQPTLSWRPGTFATTPATQVTLNGPDGAVNMPIAVRGLEYNTGSSAPTVVMGPGTGTVCANAQTSSNSFYIIGITNCTAGFSLSMPNAMQPFYFLRPIFRVDESLIASAFAGKEEGLYSGSIPLMVRYEYRSATGTVTYRVLPQSMAVQIHYKPSFLTSVEVTGNGIMPPIYDQLTQKVSATTTFAIQANGYFGNGLMMSFSARDYELVGPTNIPYSIVCDGACSQTNIVTAGVLNHNSVVVAASGSNKTTINFNLDVSYDNIDITNVETGTYSDNFIVMFEVNL